jgi:alkanesulfonate monooxygenase SsuD/methylene tetrahydromethanopterin reductase-like flavin-dependent oxidoreductase (luciferase family)
MQYGLVLPMLDVQIVPGLAAEAEAAGWDGVFIPDCINIDPRFNGGVPMPADDPWIVLAAVAIRTERIRFGTMITPPSRRRPWKLARELTALDRLSNGRVILPVGLGALDDQGFGAVGEATDRKTRAELLDETLDILRGLWSGESFSYEGRHYQVENLAFAPTPVQHPIPIWCVGLWPVERSMRRAARYNGLLPNIRKPDGSMEITPDDIRAMRDWLDARRDTSKSFDIVMEGSTPADDRAALDQVAPYAEAGVTWWLDSFWSPPNDADAIRRRIVAGPPRQ